MRNTTSENFRLRLKWLAEITERKINPSKLEINALSTMRLFCGLRVSKWFDKISLNSLKSTALELSEQQRGLDLWIDLKSMRAAAFALHVPNAATPPTAPMPSAEDQAKSALLDAHISSMAYFELYKFMSLLVQQNSNNASEILASIDIKLQTSKAKHHSFLIHHNNFTASSLTVIKGGKDGG
jgi:hypothetical protein